MTFSKPFIAIAALTAFFTLSSAHKSLAQTINAPVMKGDPFNVTYPWKKNITATIFWIGEKPTPKNPTPNHASSWDTQWQKNYGGYDNPNPAARKGYRPKAFIPKLNPFYVALPYNDCLNYRTHCPQAGKVVYWWHRRADKRPGKTALKGRWLEIVYGNKRCYAQWEDCGPFTTKDHAYVFGNSRPKNTKNNGAGIDLSPAVRDYLGLKSNAKVHWRFMSFKNVPRGPWSQYGKNNPFLHPDQDPDYQARQNYTNYLRRKRDEAYQR
ncbi:MAG: hypothetical protein ACSHX0_10890 [Akkermansiaceae bacterium]